MAVLLFACSTTRATPLEVPEGAPAEWRVTCEKEMRACERKAEELCEVGHVVLKREVLEEGQERVDSTGLTRSAPKMPMGREFRAELWIRCGPNGPALTR